MGRRPWSAERRCHRPFGSSAVAILFAAGPVAPMPPCHGAAVDVRQDALPEVRVRDDRRLDYAAAFMGEPT
jgi:hypothetical protein